MIRVFSFLPEFFNNNGDQGNLEALAHFLNEKLEPAEIQDAEFVLFGDASRAPIREFEKDLRELVPALQLRLDKGLPTLLVGSSFEFLAPLLVGMPKIQYGERVSEFRQASDSGLTAKGYRNSEVVSGDLVIRGAFVGTTLFGPILAKNIELLELIAERLGKKVRVSTREREWISKL